MKNPCLTIEDREEMLLISKSVLFPSAEAFDLIQLFLSFFVPNKVSRENDAIMRNDFCL